MVKVSKILLKSGNSMNDWIIEVNKVFTYAIVESIIVDFNQRMIQVVFDKHTDYDSHFINMDKLDSFLINGILDETEGFGIIYAP